MVDGGNPDLEDTADDVRVDPGISWFYESEPRVRARVEVAGRSHPGKVRINNEDHFLAVRRYRGRDILATSLPAGVLLPSEEYAYAFAVADGMGGRNFGEMASMLAPRAGFELGSVEIKWPMKMNEREAAELRQKVETFFTLVNQALRAEVRESPSLAGMGTTATIAYSTGHDLFVGHVGDSRAYLYRGGALAQLTRDHNVAQALIDSGIAAPGSEKARRGGHVLTSYLDGPDESLTIDVLHEPLADGDRLLLCTDGLTDMVPDPEVARILDDHLAPADACEALIAQALAAGGKVNVTVLVARYRFGGEPGMPYVNPSPIETV